MIIPGDIKPHEVVQVFIDDPRYDCLAKVLANEGAYLFVTYLEPTGKVFKGAKVFSFESKAERLDFDSILVHHTGICDVTELGIRVVGKNMYVYEDDVDPESESEVESDEDSEESSSESADEDSEEDLSSRDPELDEQWNSWTPSSAGARRFKEAVDRIEMNTRHTKDSF